METELDVLKHMLKISNDRILELKEEIRMNDLEIEQLKRIQKACVPIDAQHNVTVTYDNCTFVPETDIHTTLVEYQKGITFTIHPCDNGCGECKNTACIDPERMKKFLGGLDGN